MSTFNNNTVRYNTGVNKLTRKQDTTLCHDIQLIQFFFIEILYDIKTAAVIPTKMHFHYNIVELFCFECIGYTSNTVT